MGPGHKVTLVHSNVFLVTHHHFIWQCWVKMFKIYTTVQYCIWCNYDALIQKRSFNCIFFGFVIKQFSQIPIRNRASSSLSAELLGDLLEYINSQTYFSQSIWIIDQYAALNRKKYGIRSCVTIMETNIGCVATLILYSRTTEWKLWNRHNIAKTALDNCE